jgi:hypothetical protein
MSRGTINAKIADKIYPFDTTRHYGLSKICSDGTCFISNFFSEDFHIVDLPVIYQGDR